MYAKQYEITLPADYDMAIIRERVARAALDGCRLPRRARPRHNAHGGLTTLIEREAQQLRRLATQDGVHTAALAVDPHHWHLLRFVLWADSPAGDEYATEHYEVLHLSSPGLRNGPSTVD
ncbi:DUF4865 family protein [Amycolatopsis suaedae]|uniref:DUF4865 family protein n=1 Tax=Amycolatopsis suaedae TaxID=2510978 RepID=A0A4Q7JDB2_9PSEU|nr:DUF4865 family protein [Amycolatopsis suaedae]RZQ64603.1 DUF4865 family protein [Amycolatopsis suaedae]